MVKEVSNVFKDCNHLITSVLKRRRHFSGPTVPCLYCLPKIHKPGKTMRPIVSTIGPPTYKLAKWLSREFNNLTVKQSSFPVKNFREFISRVQNIKLNDGEVLISFDVSSLFPSVSIPRALDHLKDLLFENGFADKIV